MPKVSAVTPRRLTVPDDAAVQLKVVELVRLARSLGWMVEFSTRGDFRGLETYTLLLQKDATNG